MQFRVGTYTYRLYLETDPIMHNGEECLALSESSGRRIRMSAKVPPDERLTVLLHELRHCWGFHVPPPSFEEQECDLLAMISEAAYTDLERQGGPRALQQMGAIEDQFPVSLLLDTPAQAAQDEGGIRYVPAGDMEPWETSATASGERVQCAECCLIVAGGSVVNERLRFEDKAVGWVLTRTMYCGHCGHLQVWDEGATPTGLPNGSPVGQPKTIRGRAVDEFLQKHPQAAAMVCG